MGIFSIKDDDKIDEEYALTDEELKKMLDYSECSGPYPRFYIEHIPFGARICVATSKEEAYKKLYPRKDKPEEEVVIQQLPLNIVIPVHGYLW